jgi:signal transduction histidine kinase
VCANDDRLRQALINLLSNAVYYNNAEEPEVLVRSRIRGGFLNIDVIDNGGGIRADEVNAVFEKFNRGSRASREQGAGLGLPISRAIMRNMGGDLTVEFAADHTSFFRLSLTLVKGDDQANS